MEKALRQRALDQLAARKPPTPAAQVPELARRPRKGPDATRLSFDAHGPDDHAAHGGGGGKAGAE